MSTTTSIKVTYKSVSRRFSISNDSPSWLDLERQISTLFQIPISKINVSYIDEDGDEIVVSSDLELEEILKQFARNDKNNSIKLLVTTPPETSTTDTVTARDNVTTNNIGESWIIEGVSNNNNNNDNNNDNGSSSNSNSQQKQKNTITPYKLVGGGDGDNDTIASTATYQHASFADESEEEEEEQVTLSSDNKETFEKVDNTGKDKNVDTNSNSQNDNDKNDNNEKNREAKNDEDDFIVYITSNHPWLNSFFCGSSGLNRGYYNNRCNGGGGIRSNFYGPPPQFYRQRFNCRNFNNNNENEVRNNNSSCNSSGCSYKSTKSCFNRESMTAEEKADLSNKVKILNEMGFPEAKNAKYETLLRKFNGNVEHVVDVLLYWQKNNCCGANECKKNKCNYKEASGSSGSGSDRKQVEETY